MIVSSFALVRATTEPFTQLLKLADIARPPRIDDLRLAVPAGGLGSQTQRRVRRSVTVRVDASRARG
jgi:hypothetical protein